MTVVVDGSELRVLETLGYQHSAGVYAKEVEINGQAIIVTSRSARGPWKLSSPILLISKPAEMDLYPTSSGRDDEQPGASI